MIRGFSGFMNISKKLILICMFILLVAVLLQFDTPTIQGVWDSLNNKYMERQFQLSDNNGENYLEQGWVYYKLGQYEKARKMMEQVTDKEQECSSLYCLGLIDLKEGKYSDSAKKLEKLAEIVPSHTAEITAFIKNRNK